MITFRIDVDYAYSSRTKSFFYTYCREKHHHHGYLADSKRLADLINQSEIEVKAYWFFTPYTLPDNELLALLSSSRHEIGLHLANDIEKELKALQKVSTKEIKYFTIHGTSRLLGQIIWHRSLGQRQAIAPGNFVLESFHNKPTQCLDWLAYNFSSKEAEMLAKKWVNENYVLEVHPDWLLKSGGRINPRGPFIDLLKLLLFPCATS